MIWWLLPMVAYVIGSISFAWMAGKIKGVDLRQHGSGNLGATNAGRVLGKQWFVAVFLLDVAKGMLPVWVALYGPALIAGDGGQLVPIPAATVLPIAVAVGAVLGHIYTCFHGFKGGKAVATSLGVLIALLPIVAGVTFCVWLVAWIIGWAVAGLGKSNAVGPASVLAAAVAPGAHVVLSADPWQVDLPRTIFISVLAVLVIVKHRSNIAKLFQPKSAA